MSKLTKRITAMLLIGMLVLGSAPGTVFATSTDVDPGQTSEIAQEAFAEETSETPASAGETSETAEETSEVPAAAGETAKKASAEEEVVVQYYTVTLDANGGYFENEWDDAIGDYVQQAEVVEKLIPVDGTVAAFPVFTDQDVEVMLFAGWSLKRDGELVIMGDEEYTPVDNCVLYAVWQVKDAFVGETEGHEVNDEENIEQTDGVQEFEEVDAVAGDTVAEEEVRVEEDAASESDSIETVSEEKVTEFEQEENSNVEDFSDIVNENESVAEEKINENLLQEEGAKVALEDTVVDSGECGENVAWTLTGTGYEYTLFISGSGAMYNYDNTTNRSPWNQYKDDIYHVTIEDGVTSIGDYAFYANSNIESVSLSDSITSINQYAFCYCRKISNMNIPPNIEYIGYSAFCACEVWDVELTLPNSIISLGDYAFASCYSITKLKIPDAITEIGEGVFYSCNSITELNIPENITSIGKYSFQGLGIKELVIPGTVNKLGFGAFSATSVENVEISEGVNDIGAYCFQECRDLKHIALPNGITEINMGTFDNCLSLKLLDIPYGVTSIDNFAIPGSLVSLRIPETVTYIGGSNGSSQKTIYLYYGTEKQWNHVDNHGYYYKFYFVTAPVTGIECSRSEYIVGIGNTLEVRANLIPADATCNIITWEIEDNSVADIFWYDNINWPDRDSRVCYVIGRKIGSTLLKCTSADGQYTYLCNITVKRDAVSGISKSFNDNVDVGVGRSIKLSASVTPFYAANKNIIWSSSDDNIVVVDEDGNITGISIGEATITAMTEDGCYKATCAVTTYIPVSEIELSESSLTLTKGSSKIVYATIRPDNVDEGHKKLRYNISDRNIINVVDYYENDSRGCRIIAQKGGQTRVEVSSDDGQIKEYIDVTVIVPVSEVSFLSDSVSMHVDEKKQLTAKISPNDATNKRIYWSSSNEDVAKVNENGEVTALKLGETTITAVTEDGGHSASCKVSVIVPATGVELNKNNIDIFENGTETLAVTVSPEDAGDKSVVWSSSNNTIVTVDQKGMITAVKAGTATITVKSNDGGYTAACTVTVSHAWNEKYTVDCDATCSEEGAESIHCSVCNAIDATTVRSIPKKEHNYGAWSITEEATCTQEGSKEKVCADCEDKVTETIPATGHTWNEDYTVDKQATYTEEGSESIHCSVCGEIKEGTSKLIAKLPKPMSMVEVSGIVDIIYTGNVIKQDIVIKDGEAKLIQDTDYTVSYSNNKNAGNATVTITGIGDYTGTKNLTFIINSAPISNTTITGLTAKTYTGKALFESPVVKNGIITLNGGTDYDVSYRNNMNAGTATVTITGKGNYTGTKTATFKINKAAQSITAKAGTSSVAVGKTTTVSISGAKGAKFYKSSNTAVATVSSTGVVTAKKVGKVTITATSAATSNYKAASKTVTIKVVPAATSSFTATNLSTGIKLTWKKVTGANAYFIYRGSTQIAAIKNGSTVTYTDKKANTNGAKYTYKIIASASATGRSTLSKSVTTYCVARPTISTLTNSAAAKMTVKWGKNTKATGYQIQYSTSKTFVSGNKTANVTKAATVSKVIGSLTKGKTYYVRIRTYKTVGSTKYWSTWSPAKSVKISK